MSEQGFIRKGMSLSEIQEPYKQELLDNPQKAEVELHTSAVLSGLCKWKVSSEGIEYESGLPAGAGGEEGLASPGKVFLSSLCVCAGVTFSAVAENLGIILRASKSTAGGKLDLRGTMGLGDSFPVGFQSIRLVFEVDTDADDSRLKELLELAVKYSVNLQTLDGRKLLSYEITRK